MAEHRSWDHTGRRAAAIVAACAVQLILALALLSGWRYRRPAVPVPTVTPMPVMLLRGSAARALGEERTPARAAIRLLPPIRTPSPTLPNLDLSPPEPRTVEHPPREPLDWAAAAQRAARRVVGQGALLRRYHPGSAELPPWWHIGPDSRSSTPPSFPWSRQPLTSWFDIDYDHHWPAVSVSIAGRCKLFLALSLPFFGFGCAIGHLPDQSRGDLFDPEYLPRPLRLPGPALVTPPAQFATASAP
ncbi:MAG: hypothetical protein ACREU3_09265 [Steroidobacteraceae bacterium]